MNILEIPFNEFLNITDYPGEEYIYKAEERPEYFNHLKTIHACVQLSLAEASSGGYLLREFKQFEDKVIPVIRKTEAKYHKPANGTLYARAKIVNSEKQDVIDELANKKRAIVQIKVEVLDESNKKVLTATFDWFLKVID